MENNIRFRNHFSMIFQYLTRFVWLMFLASISAIFNDGFEVSVMLVVFAILFLIYTILLWAKTWITIGEQSIVIERNMLLSRKKNTIGMSNISNVNLEQGLIAMLFGTCKLKMDTNSLSTANATDVTIVLKKKDAERIRALLMKRISGEELEESVESKVPDMEEKPEGVHVTTKDIILHGVYGSRFLYTIFVPLFILLQIFAGLDAEDIDFLIEEVGAFATETVGIGILILIAMIAWGVLTAVFSLAQSTIRYWEFRIERKSDKLVLNYGLTKKINYSIPVDKIQAVVLKQSFLARLCKRYMVEVINVGMNDDEREAQAFLLPYSKKELLQERLQQLLPEFAGCLEMESERQPRTIWVVWLWSVFVYLLIAGAVIAGIMASGLHQLEPVALSIACGVMAFIGLLLLIGKIAAYLTRGTQFGDKVFLVVNGRFAREHVFIKYDKIQHLQLHQNFIAKRFGIQRGVGYILAAMQNSAHNIPYFEETKIEHLKSHL